MSSSPELHPPWQGRLGRKIPRTVVLSHKTVKKHTDTHLEHRQPYRVWPTNEHYEKQQHLILHQILFSFLEWQRDSHHYVYDLPVCRAPIV